MSKSVPAPTLKQLRECCREWQKALRLQDWRIKIRYSEKGEFPEGKEGGAAIYLVTKQAVIAINPAARHEHGEPDPIEVALIHELLHLHFDGAFEKELEGAERRIHEAGIDCTAWALYRLKHGPKTLDPFTED